MDGTACGPDKVCIGDGGDDDGDGGGDDGVDDVDGGDDDDVAVVCQRAV